MQGFHTAEELALAISRRELQEETGHVTEDWRHLGVMHPCIGYSNERIEIFIARGLEHVGHAWDEGEFLEILSLSLAEAPDLERYDTRFDEHTGNGGVEIWLPVDERPR